jgi:hypothetical protein
MKENSIISRFRLWLDHKIFMVNQKLFGPRIKGESNEITTSCSENIKQLTKEELEKTFQYMKNLTCDYMQPRIIKIYKHKDLDITKINIEKLKRKESKILMKAMVNVPVINSIFLEPNQIYIEYVFIGENYIILEEVELVN